MVTVMSGLPINILIPSRLYHMMTAQTFSALKPELSLQKDYHAQKILVCKCVIVIGLLLRQGPTNQEV